jgi:prepilin-type processing-associated H-X9-DG protein
MNANAINKNVSKFNSPANTVLLWELQEYISDSGAGTEYGDNTLTTGTYFNTSASPPFQAPSGTQPANTSADMGSIAMVGKINWWCNNDTDRQHTTPGDIGACHNNGWAWDSASHGPIHGGIGANWLAADGHVKFLRPEKVSPGVSASKANSPHDGDCNTATDATTMTQKGTPVTMTFSTY